MDSTEPFAPETAEHPIPLFAQWLEEATATEVNDPIAMALATSTVDGYPSVRMVLMKRLDERGFSFYTNAESQKGRELLANPRAALCFHWKSRRRQVRVEGLIQQLPPEDADTYFHSRSRRSQIGALASQQSRPLGSRAELEHLAEQCAEQHPGEIPRPSYWRGFVLTPTRIEFWQDGPHRLHDRIVFERPQEDNLHQAESHQTWTKTRLFP